MSNIDKPVNPVDIITEIENLVKNGLVKGYRQNIFFTQNYSDLQSRVIEYLIVVNIAQELEHYAFQNYIQVNLEYSLNDFYNNSFPSVITTGKIFAQDLKHRKNHTPIDSKSKRIDIALTKDVKIEGELISSIKSFVGIEVKSINQPNKKIKKDIERMATAMNLQDDIGSNNIACCFSCFFKRFDSDSTTISKQEIVKKTAQEKAKWEAHFKKVEDRFPKLNFELLDTNIVNLPVDDFKYESPEIDYDYEDLLEKTGFINAYMVKITRNESK